MLRFEQEVTNFYAKHKQANEKLETVGQHLSGVEADAQFRGRIALKDNNPVLHQEARDLFQRSDILTKQKITAQRKYDKNIEDAAAHKDKNFDNYVADARSDMSAQHAGEKTVVQAAEDILKSANPDKIANPHTDNSPL